MKNFKYEIILCVLMAMFIAISVLPCMYYTALNGYLLFIGDFSISEWKKNMDDIYSTNLLCHDIMIDVNSAVLNYSGIKYIKKEDCTVVKLKNDYLTGYEDYLSDEQILYSVDKIKKLSDYSQNSGADFLYVACPSKSYNADYPAGVDNFNTINCDRFYEELKSASVPSIIFVDEMKAENIKTEDAFFITDHHWKPETGFWASCKILDRLSLLYGLNFDTEKASISNFTIQVYQDWFLGSWGKKVGRYYTDLGVDDISIIKPEFNTWFTEEVPYKNEVRDGDFSNTLLYMDKICRKDLYKLNPYMTYCGGDYHLQIIKNHCCNNGKTLLIDRDSFGCVVVPFLALQYENIYVTDMHRICLGYKPDLYQLIDEIHPDSILTVFSGVPTPEPGGNLDFGSPVE